MCTKLLICLAVVLQLTADDPTAKYRSAATERWEQEIQKLEQLDKTEVDPAHAILFIGSSSIRRWEEIAEDLKPWPVIRRGYGGAKFSDLAVFADRLVSPHKFDALAIFVGNDVSGKADDKSPEEVLALYQYVVETVREKNPAQPIFFIAITPTGSRFSVWDKIQEVNRKIREYSETDDKLHFIETAASYLDKDGKPRDELFVEDRLHLNRDGYQIWARLIKAEFDKVLRHPQ